MCVIKCNMCFLIRCFCCVSAVIWHAIDAHGTTGHHVLRWRDNNTKNVYRRRVANYVSHSRFSNSNRNARMPHMCYRQCANRT